MTLTDEWSIAGGNSVTVVATLDYRCLCKGDRWYADGSESVVFDGEGYL
jgi:hypothetical protein